MEWGRTSLIPTHDESHIICGKVGKWAENGVVILPSYMRFGLVVQ